MIYFKNPLFIEKKINKKIKNKVGKKFFCLPMFPYPSGKLHIGHARNYVLSDVISRYKKISGYSVMHPIAWDAFGIPAENAAKKYNLSPEKWTISNIKFMKKQLKLLSINFDKSEFLTCNYNFYNWEYYILILLFKNNLLFKKKEQIFWDKKEQNILSNEQVINKKGWRSETNVEIKNQTTWFIKTKKYSKRLLNNLKFNKWAKKIKNIQKKWIKIKILLIKKNFKYFINNIFCINIKKIFIKNKKIIFFLIKNLKEKIFKLKIFNYNYKKKKIIILNFDFFFFKNKKKMFNFFVKEKNFFLIKKTNLKNWSLIRNNKWGSFFFFKKILNLKNKNKKTLDTFFQSSWYYLKYFKTNNFINKKKIEWLPIDVYIGGIEHANLHLIYLRLINKIFYDFNIFKIKEIVLNLINQGFVNNKVYYKIINNKIIYNKKKDIFYKIEKMSKSKKNGINPIKLVKKFGSDLLRLYLITFKPINKNIVWNQNNFYSLKNFFEKINKIIFLKNKKKNIFFSLKNFYNIKKIHKIVSEINKILLINTTLIQLKIIIFFLFPITPNISKILWFKIEKKKKIENFKYNFINKKIFNVFYKNIFLKNINNINSINFINKKIFIKIIIISINNKTLFIK